MLLQYLAAEWVYLHLPSTLHASTLQPEVEAADASEEAAKSHQLNSIPALTRQRGPVLHKTGATGEYFRDLTETDHTVNSPDLAHPVDRPLELTSLALLVPEY